MMTASPNDVRFANDMWLRHVLWQASHHCEMKWSNIIFAKQMHHIAVGDFSLFLAKMQTCFFIIDNAIIKSIPIT